ncbi:hypothetical protein O8W32_01755 [Methanomassiliicoccales archaeon LGM-DZ1]|nr:hypothetical protein O8W32_01755 [Methanomassiliicoccales archaeon LGM-DZ1]
MRNRTTAEGDVFIATFNEKNRTVSDDHLTMIFSAVGARHGYEDVGAEFAALEDFKVRWQRSYDWIRFTVSDYLDRAPDDVLASLAEVLFTKIEGGDRDYDECFVKYITSPELTKANRKDFLKRKRDLSKKSIGTYHDLNDCVNRLRDEGLLPDDMNCELRWQDGGGYKASGCSVLQRVVWVNNVLDQKGVPEHVLDYSVYAMMCHLIAGFDNRDEFEYRRLLSFYPMKRDAEDWLEREGLYI